jgi:Putative transposase
MADIDAHGFSLHAGVRCGAGDVVLQLKSAWRDGTTHIKMSPLEFMQRLAALVPRPRLHLIRFHGVLAPAQTRFRNRPRTLPAVWWRL